MMKNAIEKQKNPAQDAGKNETEKNVKKFE